MHSSSFITGPLYNFNLLSPNSDSSSNSEIFLQDPSKIKSENDDSGKIQGSSSQDVLLATFFKETFNRSFNEPDDIKSEKKISVLSVTDSIRSLTPISYQDLFGNLFDQTQKINIHQLKEAMIESLNEVPDHNNDVVESVDVDLIATAEASAEKVLSDVSYNCSQASVDMASEDTSNPILQKKSPSATNSSQSLKKSLTSFPESFLNTYKFFNNVYSCFKNVNTVHEYAPLLTETIQDPFLQGTYRPDLENLTGHTFKTLIGEINFYQRLGQGSFGDVYRGFFIPNDGLEAFDVALKVNRLFENHAETELVYKSLLRETHILKTIDQIDSEHTLPITRYIDSCIIRPKKFCLIQPLYGPSLHELIKKTGGCGVSFRIVYKVAVQLFKAMDFFQESNLKLIHFDLKPENILLENSRTTKIRIIDFGAARETKELSNGTSYLVTRYYRAPEIILGLPYTHAVDIWSIACILIEMHISHPIFPAKNTWELLIMMYDFLGPLPKNVIQRVHNYEKNFVELEDRPGFYRFANAPIESYEAENRRAIFERKLNVEYREKILSSDSNKFHFLSEELYNHFKDMIHSMLNWDPQLRASAKSLLEHPFMVEMNKRIEGDKQPTV